MRIASLNEAALIEELPALYELLLTDLRVGELLDERAQIDDGSSKEADLARAEARLAEAEEQLTTRRATQIDLRLERDGLKERRERDQHRLWQEAPSVHEAEALQLNLQSSALRLDEIATLLLDLDNRIEPLEHQREDEQRTRDELQAELSVVQANFAEQVKGIDAELRELHARRQAQMVTIAPVLLARYELIRSRRGDPGLVRVDGDTCEACHTQLTNYMQRQLQAGLRVQQCENCNTILYWVGEARRPQWDEELDGEELVVDDSGDE